MSLDYRNIEENNNRSCNMCGKLNTKTNPSYLIISSLHNDQTIICYQCLKEFSKILESINVNKPKSLDEIMSEGIIIRDYGYLNDKWKIARLFVTTKTVANEKEIMVLERNCK